MVDREQINGSSAIVLGHYTLHLLYVYNCSVCVFILILIKNKACVVWKFWKQSPEVRQRGDILCKAALVYAGWGRSPWIMHRQTEPYGLSWRAWWDVIKDLYPLGLWTESTLWSNVAEVFVPLSEGHICPLKKTKSTVELNNTDTVWSIEITNRMSVSRKLPSRTVLEVSNNPFEFPVMYHLNVNVSHKWVNCVHRRQ